MKLDAGEKLELETAPNQNILIMWFLNKTLTYSFAAMFFVFTTIFFINTFSTLSDHTDDTKTEMVDKAKTSGTADNKKMHKKTIGHPFQVMFDYWGWALLLVAAVSIAIQAYLFFLRRTYHYIITDRRCIFIGGILKRVERTVPHKKITDIQRSQNIIERMLGIWNVQVFTPGTASVQIGHAKAKAELNFDGLTESEEVYEAISRHAQING